VEHKPDQKAERVLGLVEPGRRNAMRKMLAAAYVAPAVASFSLDALATPIASCVAANQGPILDDTTFSGKMDCDGFRLDKSVPNGVAEHVHFQLTNVVVRLRSGPTGGSGFIMGGAATSLLAFTPSQVTISFADFPDKKDEKVGFAVTDCPVAEYYETGQWKRTTDKKGRDSLDGDSMVLVNSNGFSASSGITYSLKCHYDLDEVIAV